MRPPHLPALAAGLLLLTFAAPAAAIPPGGPAERRDGAALTLSTNLVAPGGDVAFTGTGWGSGTVVSVKVDDGLVLPAAPVSGTDVIATATADGGGAISGTVRLADVRAADHGAVAAGVHRLRALSSAPAHSVHADFAVRTPTGPPIVNPAPAASVFAGPPADQLTDFPFSGDPDGAYDDLPRLVAGSAIPYRYAGFDAGQSVTVKVDDGANLAVTTADASGARAGYAEAPDVAAGTHWLRYLAGVGGGTARSLRAPFEVVANGGRDVRSSPAAIPGGAVAFATTGLVRSPADYVPVPATGQTLQARFDGQAPVDATADAAGAATGRISVPAGTAPGTYDVVYWVGFRKQNDFPQAVFVRRVTVAEALPDASAELGAGAVAAGGNITYTLRGFAQDAGGGQKVAVSVDGGAALACVSTDVAGEASGVVTLPAAVGAGAHVLRFRAGDACGAGAEAPARDVTAPVTVTETAPPADRPAATPPAAPPIAALPAVQARAVAIRSTGLRVKGDKITFVVAPGSAKVKASVALRTRGAVKLTPRARKRAVVTLARRALTIAPGTKARTITLVLTKGGRTLLARHRRLAVRLTIAPAKGKAITKALTLRK